MSNHINEILFALADEGVEFILGGGVAAVLHGVERVTLDIDLDIAEQAKQTYPRYAL